MGADHVVNVKNTSSSHYSSDLTGFTRERNGGALADRAIVATTSRSACQQTIEITGAGSIVVYMGLSGPKDAVQLPLLESLVQAKQTKFAWLYPHQWPKTLKLLETSLIDTSLIITHVLPLERVTEAIDLLGSRDNDAIKVLLKP